MAPNSIGTNEELLSSEGSSNHMNFLETRSVGGASVGGVSKTSTSHTGGVETFFETEQDDKPRPEHIDPVVAEKEERAVFWSRIIVIGIFAERNSYGLNSFVFQNVETWCEDDIEFEGITKWTAKELLNFAPPFIHGFGEENIEAKSGAGPFLPVFHSFPLLQIGVPLTQLDVLEISRYETNFWSSCATNLPSLNFANNIVGDITTGEFELRLESQLFQPVFDAICNGKRDRDELTMVACVILTLDWSAFFENLLPENVKGVTLVLSSSCSEDIFTYQIDGLDVIPVGAGDLHETACDDMVETATFVSFDYDKSDVPDDVCISEITLSLHPTHNFEESFCTNEAICCTVGAIAIFAFTSLVFCIHDWSVKRRQSKVMDRVIRQDKIVSNIFPTAIRDRLHASKAAADKASTPEGFDVEGDLDNPETFGGAPLTELHPEVSVVFADIAGFTAWSSTREPSHVFLLLESICGAFDKIAYRHGVFKVETVGDCYAAVAGLPDYREDHALIVAKFARDCLHKMSELTRKLEVTLGPDTTNLGLRVGLHTGQVTAGVLRGERSRFQLFGDTVNTASRMESTGVRGSIQASSAAAAELKKWKRGKWIRPQGQDCSQGEGRNADLLA